MTGLSLAPPLLPCYHHPDNTITTTRACDGCPSCPACSPSPEAGFICCPLRWAEEELPYIPPVTSPTVYGESHHLCHRPGKGPLCTKQNCWRRICRRVGEHES